VFNDKSAVITVEYVKDAGDFISESSQRNIIYVSYGKINLSLFGSLKLA